MDGSQGLNSAGAESGLSFPIVVDQLPGLVRGAKGLTVRRNDRLESIILTKTVPGLSADIISALRGVVREAAAGRLGRIKFLVFDFAHDGFALSIADEGLGCLLAEIEDLILAAPVVTVASARANLAGADLELALACSMLVARAEARFSFAADPLVSIRTYALLAQKIGFVRTERLMEDGQIVGTEELNALYLLKGVLEDGGMAGLEEFLRKTARRHNAFYGVYRARRISTGSVDEALRGANIR